MTDGASLADRYDAFLIDLDGTIYKGEDAVQGASEAVHRLHASGKKVVFLTNNSGRTPEEIASKLVGIGVEARFPEIVTSALVTAKLLSERGAKTAYVVGMAGIRQALTAAGVTVLEGEPEAAEYVVVGWDKDATYTKLKNAGLLVQRGAKLVATNPDRAYPASDGLWPGAGALLSVITTTTGAEAEIVGKPHTPLCEAALEVAGGGRPLVVGDRLDTDVAAATALGWDSLLVFTGIADPADVDSAAAKPTYVGSDLSALFEPVRAEDLRPG
ncbi:MAG: HAD-IIA family hydrolase [Actinomycetota bacterium]